MQQGEKISTPQDVLRLVESVFFLWGQGAEALFVDFVEDAVDLSLKVVPVFATPGLPENSD